MFKDFGKPEEILSQFDFSITKFAYYKAIIEDETGAEREEEPIHSMKTSKHISNTV